MPDFHLEKPRAVLLVNVLLAAADRQKAASGNRRQIVHFDQTSQAGKDVFSRKCGSCHRALTVRLGGVMRDRIVTLLSAFRDRRRWTERDLGIWLKNPRRIRPWARMQPVLLIEAEFRELVDILKVGH